MRVIRDNARAQAFPLAGLPIMSRREARTAGALASVARHVVAVSGRVAECLSRCLGCHARVEVLGSREALRPEALSGTRQAGVAARIELAEGHAAMLVLLPEGLLRRLAAGIFSLPLHEASPDRSVFEALAAILLLDILAAPGAGSYAARLTALTMTDDFFKVASESKGDAFCLHVKVSLLGGSDICTLLLPESDLPALGGARPGAAGAAASRSLLRRLRMPVALVCAAGLIPCGRLAGMEAGDVLIPDAVAARAPRCIPESIWIALRDRGRLRKIAEAAARGAAISITETFMTKGETMTQTHDDPAGNDKTTVEPRQGDIPSAVRDLPVEVAVEAARIEMSIDEIASLSPGSIITLERPLSSEVTLTSAGSIVAYGMLVSVEGEMGVQILKVRE